MADQVRFKILLDINDDGKLVKIELPSEEVDEMRQSDEAAENFLEHFGIKGMKWGVRKASYEGGGGGRPPSARRAKRQAEKADLNRRKGESKERLAAERKRRDDAKYDDQVSKVRRTQENRRLASDKSQGNVVKRYVKNASRERDQLDDDILTAREKLAQSDENVSVARAQYRKDKREIGRKAAKVYLNEAKEIRRYDRNDNAATAAQLTRQEAVDKAVSDAIDQVFASAAARRQPGW